MVLRILLDADVYQSIVLEEELVLKIMISKNVVVYGCKVVRNQLKDTPVYKKIKNKKIRTLMLNAYDCLVKRHDILVSDLAQYLALEYLKEFKGAISKEKMYPDFLIVACATLKGLDKICTNDFRTMKSNNAKNCYNKVNGQNGLKTPSFINFEEFKKLI